MFQMKLVFLAVLRWLKRYFILSGDSLEYYDNENLHNGKEAVLSGDSLLSYTSKDCCFVIKGLKNCDGTNADDWNLMAEDERSSLESSEFVCRQYIHTYIMSSFLGKLYYYFPKTFQNPKIFQKLFH